MRNDHIYYDCELEVEEKGQFTFLIGDKEVGRF